MKSFKITIEYDSDYGCLVINDENTGMKHIEGDVEIIGDVLDCLEDVLNEAVEE